MTTYSVHLPAEAAPGSSNGLERAVLVKDGFHWLALAFPLLWLLFNRLWWPLLAFLALTIAIVLTGRAAGIGETAIASLDLLIGLFVAIAAPEMKAWGLGRRGFALVDVVTASSRDEAERRFFERWLSRPRFPATNRPTAGAAPGLQPQPQVLGLFPDAGSVR